MSFTVFDKMGDSLSTLPDDVRARMFAALCEYGCYGTEPEFDGPYAPFLAALFTSFREDVDNSKQARDRGGRGGRPASRKHQDAEVSENSKPEVSEDAKPLVSENEKPVVSEKSKPLVCEKSKPVVSESRKPKPNQTIDKPDQTRERGSARKAALPPTPAQVREYADAHGLAVDSERFCDYYAAQGWRLANGNTMRDWRAAVRNWARGGVSGGAGPRGTPAPSQAERDEWDNAGASGAARVTEGAVRRG